MMGLSNDAPTLKVDDHGQLSSNFQTRILTVDDHTENILSDLEPIHLPESHHPPRSISSEQSSELIKSLSVGAGVVGATVEVHGLMPTSGKTQKTTKRKKRDEGSLNWFDKFGSPPPTSDPMIHPTPEQLSSLPRIPGPLNLPTFLIAIVEFAERFSYYGTTVVFTNFIQRPLPPGSTTGSGGVQSGALGMGQQAATGITTFNTFWVYFCPLIGAYVADAHLGRYNTILLSIFIALVGHVLLVISAIPSVIVHPDGSLACFIIAIIIMGIGTGGFKPNISPLVAEQAELNQGKPFIKVLQKTNQQVIVDPSLTSGRIYMYFYLLINLGALTGQIGMAYAEKYVGFWLAYLLPTLLFCICPLVMILGKPIYVLRPATGSVFGQAVRLTKLAFVKKIRTPKSQKIGFWEAVKPSNLSGQKPSWMNFDDQWVDEVKRGVKACRVFLWFPIYWLTYNQMSNNLTSQAGVMNTHGLPNDVLSNLDPLALMIFIPICDLLLYPALRKLGIKFSPIKRITAGFIVGAMAMFWAALTQHWIYERSVCGNRAADPNCPVVDLSVWVQTPAYILIALSEIFASITGLEYAFTLAPKNMRSLVTALFLFQTAIASAIGEAFNPLSSDPLLVWNYGTMAVLAFVVGVAFYCFHRNLDREHDDLLLLKEGHLDESRKEPGKNDPIIISHDHQDDGHGEANHLTIVRVDDELKKS